MTQATDYSTALIAVDFYKANVMGEYICSCYTPNARLEEEPEYLVKTVTYAALHEQWKGEQKRLPETKQEQYILFTNWLNTATKEDIQQLCSRVINIREGRTGYYSPKRIRA